MISAGDREADIYELLVQAQEHSERGLGLLVRFQHDRKLEGEELRLWEKLSRTPSQGRVILLLPRSRGLRQREVEFTIRYREVELASPAHKRRYLQMTRPAKVTVIELKETRKRNGIHWRLLTTEPVASVEEAKKIAGWYAKRWQVEVLHRVLKTGCRVERRQMRETSDARDESTQADDRDGSDRGVLPTEPDPRGTSKTAGDGGRVVRRGRAECAQRLLQVGAEREADARADSRTNWEIGRAPGAQERRATRS